MVKITYRRPRKASSVIFKYEGGRLLVFLNPAYSLKHLMDFLFKS
uniref:Uncharacterized protein n=1 Tax=Arundo donax TaxID=35708 RepID=A0A0A9HGS2_ARUDO